MSGAWAIAAAERIGRRAGAASAVSGRPRGNPFTGKGLDELAAAWQAGYDAATRPGPAGG